MSQSIDSILNERRVFQPPQGFSQIAHIKSLAQYEQLYREAEEDPGARAKWERLRLQD